MNTIPEYIENWLTIIENMKNDNTYKPCFGRGLLECIINHKFTEHDDGFYISFEDISKNMIRYYWNQLFFFKLKQSANDKKPPVICQKVNELIDIYKTNKQKTIPIFFDYKNENKIVKVIKRSVYQEYVNEVSRVIPENVLWRFKICNSVELPLYEFNVKKKVVIFDKYNLIQLMEYNVIIAKLLNYKWAQLLEKYNTSPRIVNKVQSIAENRIRRNDLSNFKEQLLKQFKNNKYYDFYTDKELKYDDITLDHVIPWSYMYSDDIWNLVITSRSNNSKKSNSIPSQEIIDKLKERNSILINDVDSKFKDDLIEAKKESLVDRYYYECKL